MGPGPATSSAAGGVCAGGVVWGRGGSRHRSLQPWSSSVGSGVSAIDTGRAPPSGSASAHGGPSEASLRALLANAEAETRAAEVRGDAAGARQSRDMAALLRDTLLRVGAGAAAGAGAGAAAGAGGPAAGPTASSAARGRGRSGSVGGGAGAAMAGHEPRVQEASPVRAPGPVRATSRTPLRRRGPQGGSAASATGGDWVSLAPATDGAAASARRATARSQAHLQ